MPSHLFVYGTLRSACGHEFARFLAAHARLLGPARMPGRLYRLGDYPGLQPSSEPHEWVIGELYELPYEAALLPVLDRYEGCARENPAPHEFERITTTALLANGRPVPAWVYVYTGPVSESQRILSGDYLSP